MPRLFDQLDPSIQQRLFKGVVHTGARYLSSSKPEQRHIDLFDDHFTLFRACADGNLDALRSLLDLGLPLDQVPARHSDWASPLCLVIQHAAPKAATRMLDLLLSRGANPNFIPQPVPNQASASPMHAGCANPEVVARLIAAGGDVRLASPAYGGLLDQWLWHFQQLAPAKHAAAFKALDILLGTGLSPTQPLLHGTPFLVRAWGIAPLRPFTMDLIDRGFDPYKRSAAQGPAGNSLAEFLEKNPPRANAAAHTKKLTAFLAATALDATTPKVVSRSTRSRM